MKGKKAVKKAVTAANPEATGALTELDDNGLNWGYLVGFVQKQCRFHNEGAAEAEEVATIMVEVCMSVCARNGQEFHWQYLYYLNAVGRYVYLLKALAIYNKENGGLVLSDSDEDGESGLDIEDTAAETYKPGVYIYAEASYEAGFKDTMAEAPPAFRDLRYYLTQAFSPVRTQLQYSSIESIRERKGELLITFAKEVWNILIQAGCNNIQVPSAIITAYFAEEIEELINEKFQSILACTFNYVLNRSYAPLMEEVLNDCLLENKLTPSEIARKAGITPGAVYQKRDKLIDTVRAELQRALRAEGNRTMRVDFDTLKEYFKGFKEFDKKTEKAAHKAEREKDVIYQKERMDIRKAAAEVEVQLMLFPEAA